MSHVCGTRIICYFKLHGYVKLYVYFADQFRLNCFIKSKFSINDLTYLVGMYVVCMITLYGRLVIFSFIGYNSLD